ncbi:MAG: FAD synthetase family protein [Rikenellaceae bacterium]
MEVFVNPENRISDRGSVVTIGSFDGVHYGHRVILSELKKVAQLRSLDSALLTLFPHPRKVLGLDLDGFGVLNSLKEKEQLLEAVNIDLLAEIEFTKDFSMLSAREFTKKFLVDKLNVKVLIIGYDHHLGRDRKGGYEELQALGEEFGFEVIEISKQNINNHKVSSTVIREALKRGDMDVVSEALGYRYSIEGYINDEGCFFAYDDMKLFPKAGKYNATVEYNGVTKVLEIEIYNNSAIFKNNLDIKKQNDVKIIL